MMLNVREQEKANAFMDEPFDCLNGLADADRMEELNKSFPDFSIGKSSQEDGNVMDLALHRQNSHN